MDSKSVHIVTLGGGNGHSHLLENLKTLPNISISAIVAMTDNGKSTGVLRKEFNILPPGDIRRCIGALASQEPELTQVLEYRFSTGFLKGHAFGNLLILALTQQLGSFEAAVDYVQKILGTQGEVIPCTLDNTQLRAELQDGQVLLGEETIDVTTDKARSPISRLSIEPQVQANPRATKAIAAADVIIFGPGDLYTSIIPSFLPEGLPQALQASQAQKILVCNRAQKQGETHDMTALNLIEEVERYSGVKIDLLLADNFHSPVKPFQPIHVDSKAVQSRGTKVHLADMGKPKDPARLDLKKVVAALSVIWQRP